MSAPGPFEGDAGFLAWDERSWALAKEAPRAGYVFRCYERTAPDRS